VADVALTPIDPAADSQRLQAAMSKWRKRSHMIRFFRRALPAAMALIVLALVGWVGLQALRSPAAERTESVSVRMLNPRFRGRDEQGRAYVMAARTAARDSRDFQRVLLTEPFLSLDSGGGRPLTVRAKRGVYHERTLLMVLEGAVHVEDPSGWVFDTERAVVETNKSIISGDTPLKGVGPMGSIAGASYVIYNQGERFIVRGNVRTTILRSPPSSRRR
jgi:lipopolysaccharide export system protein LptC